MSFDAFPSAAPASPGPDAGSASSSHLTPVPSAPAPAPSPQPAAPAPSPAPSQPDPGYKPAAAAGSPEAEAAKYSPNYKFKVMDKEHEIPEAFRSIIKDAETEKQAREIFEKAYGLDVVKPRLKEFQEKYKAAEQQLSGFQASVNELRDLYSRGDFEGFFNRLQIPTEKVLQWVIDKAKYQELPPEQRQVLDARKQAEERAYALERQNRELQAQYEAHVTQARAQGLQVALEKPDVAQFAQQFEARVGKPGAFREAVIELGDMTWERSKGRVDLTPEQAIKQLMDYYAPFLGTQPANPVQQMIPANGSQPVAAPAKAAAPTIPNVSGKQTGAVAKPKFTSIEDLKKHAKQKFGA